MRDTDLTLLNLPPVGGLYSIVSFAGRTGSAGGLQGTAFRNALGGAAAAAAAVETCRKMIILEALIGARSAPAPTPASRKPVLSPESSRSGR